MRAIAAIVLIVGLLKFAQEAPDLFKKLFNFGSGMFEGLDPRGKLRGDLTAAANTARGIGNAAKGFGHAVATPFRGGAALGKGVAGAFQGAKAGGKEGGFIGGTRGLIAGARAGAHNRGFGGTLTAAANAGAGAGRLSNKNRTTYGKAQGEYNTTVGSIMDVNKAAIDKQKDAKKALEAQHKADKAKYVSDHLNQHEQEYIERAVNNEIIRKNGGTMPTNPADIERLKNEVLNDNAFMTQTKADAAHDAAAHKATFVAQADAAFNPDFEAEKSKIDNKIAELQGSAFKEHMGTVQQAFTEFTRSKDDWGKFITESYNANFEAKMHDDKMDTEIANSINDALRTVLGGNPNAIYAGNGANSNISDNDIEKLIRSIDKLNNTQNRTATQEAQLKTQTVALSQIMDNMNKAAQKTNTNISVAATAQNTYSPPPANNNNNGGGNS